ncbi:MAG: hypothetical protein GEV11_22150 [Streptosporangiales bacterium]|nr:hypothetical protein [Streptosporangiales bacterium]
MWSERDRLFPPEHGRRLAALLPDGRHVTLSGTYGCVPEDQPGRLTGLITGFLAETAEAVRGG